MTHHTLYAEHLVQRIRLTCPVVNKSTFAVENSPQ